MNTRFYEPCTWWISDKRYQIDVDYIMRFENLEEDFNKLLEKVGIKDKIELPHINPMPRNVDSDIKSSSYKSYYDDDTKKIIEVYFKSDIEEFGYEF